MKKIIIPTNKLVPATKEAPELIINQFYLTERYADMYTITTKQNSNLVSDFLILLPSRLTANVPCPVCLQKFLSKHHYYCVDIFGGIFIPKFPTDINRYGIGDVETLHFKHGIGTCYTCMDFERPFH